MGLSLCSVYLRVALAELPERQSVEKWLIDTTELEDSGPFADIEGWNLF